MSESHSTTPPTGPSTRSAPTAPASSASRIRLLVLVGLLGLMSVALWYDRKVARPAVENAYARIAQLNGEVNSQPGRKYMTKKDVQDELKRAPIETFSEGGYFVEVYGWRAGLPIKTHNYYAVYTDGPPYIFLKHYMTKIEMDELRKMPLLVLPGPGAESSEIVTTTSAPPGPGFGNGQKKGKGKKTGPDSESADPGEGAKVADVNERPGDAAPSVTESAAPAKTPAPSDSNANDKKESAASSGEATPAIEKPAADKSQPKG